MHSQNPTPPARTSHINDLREEVLAKCFAFLPLSDRVRSAMVCVHWRKLILDYSALWANLEDIDLAVLPHFLARSKGADVRLVARFVPDNSIDALCGVILPHMEHIHHLDLQLRPASNRTNLNQLGEVLLARAPRLETLNLTIDGLPVSLNSPLCGGVTPILKNLTMSGWAFGTEYLGGVRAMSLRPQDAETLSFPAVPEVHVVGISGPEGLWGEKFPEETTKLIVELVKASPIILDDGTELPAPPLFLDAFRALQEAKFSSLREITLCHAAPALVVQATKVVGKEAQVRKTDPPIVELELDGYPGPHVRMRTDKGVCISFLKVSEEGLDEALCACARRFACLRALRLGEAVLAVFSPQTLARICEAARGLTQLVLTGLPAEREWDGSEALALPALRELRVEGGPFVVVRTDDLAHLVRERLSLGPAARLTLADVEISEGPETMCRVSREELDYILKAHFADVSVLHHPQAGEDGRPAQ